MAGYTDAAFRAVCSRQGARLCFTEMVSADALSRDNGTTLRLLERSPEENAHRLPDLRVDGSRLCGRGAPDRAPGTRQSLT